MIFHQLLVDATSAPDPTQLPIWVAGPLAGLVFVLFLTGLVIPGRTYNKLSDDYDKSRELNNRVIPLAEKMTSSQDELAKSLDRVTRAMEEVLTELARNSGNDPPRGSPTRRQW